jgi:hypothetical protein
MEIKRYSEEQKATIMSNIEFLVNRAKGDIRTGAKYIRDFVLNHPDY